MNLPPEVKTIINTLNQAGFEAFAVGGCVRDTLLKRPPNDWDVTTNAKPADIQKLFPNHFYNNQFGTVTVITKNDQPSLKNIEVTTYRIDVGYSDQRHPDEVQFTDKLTEDLARRDFTINAMAMDDNTINDPFNGQQDLADKLIRAVGEPAQRFQEDALRLLRAVRFAAQLNFVIEPKTLQVIQAGATDIKAVSFERIRDELTKIVMSDSPELGFNLLQQTGLLKQILPEVAEGVGVKQNKHHVYTVFEHAIKSVQFAAQYKYALHIRLSALFHDVGKPRTKRPQGNDSSFHGHDIVGSRLTSQIMNRLRFSNKITNQVTHLVRHHMFYYDVGKVTEAGARRLLRRVGADNFNDLIKLRIAERKGSGVPKAEPYRLRHLQFLVTKAAQDPITTSALAIGGNDLIKELKLRPSPQIGGILNALLADVLANPEHNKKEILLKKALELKNKNPDDLKKMGAEAVEEADKKREEKIRQQYHV